MKVVTVDCQYVFPRFAAAFIVTDGMRAIIVENNTTHSVPLILDALRREGVKPENVDSLIVTHVHLDHAGGSSALIRACPNAKLLAHPRASKHLIDPSKLVASARHVYGEENFAKLYGTIDPIPAERVRSMEDGETLEWAGAELRFLHTRGHANHHFCVLLSVAGEPQGVFTGDAFGLAYPDLQTRGLFIFPSTSPTDFDADEARRSILRVQETGTPVAYLTHFGAVHDVPGAADQLLAEIDFSEGVLNAAVQSQEPDEDLDDLCYKRIEPHFRDRLAKQGLSWDSVTQKLLEMDLKLNAAGLAHVARKQREAKRNT